MDRHAGRRVRRVPGLSSGQRLALAFDHCPGVSFRGCYAGALVWQMFHPTSGWYAAGNYLLLGVGAAVLLLQAWMVVEGASTWRRAKGVLDQALPQLALRQTVTLGTAGCPGGQRSAACLVRRVPRSESPCAP